jgi:DUF4097 and DUF4098 domain-containing protein YvlB
MKSYPAVLAALVCLGASAGEYGSVEKEEITKALKFPEGGSSRQLVVDNINGTIAVTGYDGNEVRLVAHRTSYGDSDEKLRMSKEKITLEIKEEPGKIILSVKTPWRCEDGSLSYRERREYGFDADFDFDLKVPRKIDFALRTVNKGTITVTDMEGEFEVSNVNGGIAMSGIAGSGLVTTVNGELSVRFTKNPESRCGFRTVNGEIEVEFPQQLSADLKFKTFNGEVYSDFEVTGLPRKATAVERIGRRTLYKGDQYSSVRAGSGGPELMFETLNGDIRILHAHH